MIAFSKAVLTVLRPNTVTLCYTAEFEDSAILLLVLPLASSECESDGLENCPLTRPCLMIGSSPPATQTGFKQL